MMDSVILLNEKYKDRLGSIRQLPGLKATTNSSGIWLKGPGNNGVFQTALNSLPAAANYVVDDKGRLFPRGKQTPVGTLGELAWEPLADFISVEMPVSAMPGETSLKVPLNLSRSTIEREIYAIKTTLKDWRAYAETAPAVRLQQLRFAISETKEVLILGSPLPALRGKLYWLNRNFLLPAGFDFDPPLTAELLPKTTDMVLFDEQGKREAIFIAAFNSADRTVIRLLKM